MFPYSDFQYVSDRGMSVVIVPEAGHSMSWENPSALAAVLHHLLNQ